MHTKQILALSLTALFLFASCATQKTTPNNEAAFQPQVQLNPPAVTEPEKPQQASIDTVAAEKPAKPSKKMRKAPRVSAPLSPPAAPPVAESRPDSNLTELPPAAAPAEVKTEEVVPQEASADVGNFFSQHFTWIMAAIGGMAAFYLIVAWRRRKQQN